jgi:hypothetical protein
MSDPRTELVKYQGKLTAFPQQHPIVKVNRILLFAVLFLMVFVMLLGYLLIPDFDDLETYRKNNAVQITNSVMTPGVSAEVNLLKGQVIGLVSGSIESKLRVLEESVKMGALDNSLGTIEDLKNDIRVLRTYSDQPQKQNTTVSNQHLIEEVASLKHLIYGILVSCSLMFVAAVGIWVKYRHLPYQAKRRGFLSKD